MNIKIGCHVSNNGEQMLIGSVNEALSYKANCFMLYMGAPQNTFRKLINEFHIDEYLDIMKNNNLDTQDVIVHGPYILNFASSDDEKRDFACRFLIDEVKKVAKIKSKYLVIHPGSHMGDGSDVGCKRIAECIKRVIKETDGLDVTLLIETMAGKGGECARTFEEVKSILDMVNDDRLKVCLDTCHIFDGGYDIVNDYENVINKLDSVVGINNIKCIHLNDSKNILESHKDRHENLGFGNIGFETLKRVAYDERFKDIPKILETPYVEIAPKNTVPPYKFEIEMLRNGVFDPTLIEKIKNQ